jgi:hypothetical protein
MPIIGSPPKTQARRLCPQLDQLMRDCWANNRWRLNRGRSYLTLSNDRQAAADTLSAAESETALHRRRRRSGDSAQATAAASRCRTTQGVPFCRTLRLIVTHPYCRREFCDTHSSMNMATRLCCKRGIRIALPCSGLSCQSSVGEQPDLPAPRVWIVHRFARFSDDCNRAFREPLIQSLFLAMLR